MILSQDIIKDIKEKSNLMFESTLKSPLFGPSQIM